MRKSLIFEMKKPDEIIKKTININNKNVAITYAS